MRDRDNFEMEVSNLLRESFDFKKEATEKNRQFSTSLGWNKYLTKDLINY